MAITLRLIAPSINLGSAGLAFNQWKPDPDEARDFAYDEGGLPPDEDKFGNDAGPSTETIPRQPSDVRPRQWRADIEDCDPDTPLQVGTDYTVLFSVDPEIEGAAAAETFDESLFTDTSVEALTLTVQVSSEDFDIRGKPVADLVVPRRGRTPVPARFVVAARYEGACTITAAVHLHGNFVNLLHFTVWAGTAGPATLTKVGRPPDALRHLEPRDMSLILQRASRSGYECIITAGGVLSPTVFLPITTEELAAEIDHVQQKLLSVVRLRDDAGKLVFQTGFQIPPPLERDALRTLAKAGGRLFRKLFFHPQAGSDAKALGNYLRAEAIDAQALLTLQVVDKEAAIPWALLYVGDVSDDATLDWDYFLGLRHLIEQVPLGPLLRGRTLKISSTPELTVGLNLNLRVGPDLVNSRVQEHQQRWQHLPSQRKRLSLRPRTTRTAVLEALKDPSNGDQIVYFYCHAVAQGRNDDTGRAAITMEPNSPLTLDDLNDNAGVSLRLPKQPLVFINACESADLTPLFYTGFVPYFLSRGARGVIGTQSKMPGLFAIRFAEAFFDRLFDGQPIGEAMLATRRDFLDRYRNPLGLLYAVHCDIDTRIDPALVAPSA
ncbi:CHAT domain-containing protein [Raineyella fluvialis]|uniref:CHAT domain-containing protein n=1 Tax=Raineyella fluvialis TaxID=2662261 RepID=A0A5Q2FCK3_9ACTN|nr:CHAT domain-containing protein [Raineyella fluvialis]QGF23477.1 CHAT domain-containing protein [Raineyella fluvialis]